MDPRARRTPCHARRAGRRWDRRAAGSTAVATSCTDGTTPASTSRSRGERGLRFRTGRSGEGSAFVCAPDGLSGAGPWRGAMLHAKESGVLDDMTRQATDEAWRNIEGER